MLTRGEIVVDNEIAFTADGEVGTEGMTLVSDLDDHGLGVRRLSNGAAGLLGDGGRGGLPSLLLLLGEVFPRRERRRKGGAVGFVGSLCQAFNEGGHISIVPERFMKWLPGITVWLQRRRPRTAKAATLLAERITGVYGADHRPSANRWEGGDGGVGESE